MRIPRKYYDAELQQPLVRTVGELKAALAELPDDLAVRQGFGAAAELVVYNHGTEDALLVFREPCWDEEEE
jgi:hypothetical protein